MPASWNLYYFRLFADILNALEHEVTRLKTVKSLEEFKSHPKTLLLKSVIDQITVEVPKDPTHRKFLLGNMLGKTHTDWRRVKKGLPQRYRLFFKFSSMKGSIIYAWLNDENTYRKAGSKTDVYTVFKQKLNAKEVPSDIDELIKQAKLALQDNKTVAVTSYTTYISS